MANFCSDYCSSIFCVDKVLYAFDSCHLRSYTLDNIQSQTYLKSQISSCFCTPKLTTQIQIGSAENYQYLTIQSPILSTINQSLNGIIAIVQIWKKVQFPRKNISKPETYSTLIRKSDILPLSLLI
ncbi:hypothetical protein L6164_026236 [Bauhinia variegata]|uniref:Uncharacterized protein n=1 Tax=Bauhinia variegata TaxID=167791 RepID=A0ACB9LPR4_BAUVA|nr:hypothetical protein L6164_026236 [Bauhinia variegata]